MKTDTVFLNQWLAVEAELMASPYKRALEAMNSISAENNKRLATKKEAKSIQERQDREIAFLRQQWGNR